MLGESCILLYSGLSAGIAVGIVFAAIGAVVVIITCIAIGCICVKVLRQRKVMWKATQVISSIIPREVDMGVPCPVHFKVCIGVGEELS